MPLRFHSKFIMLVAVGAVSAAGSTAAQTARDTYALRQEMLNDSYVWEPMLKQGMADPAPRKPLVNPAALSSRTASPPLTPAAQSVLRYFGKRPPAAAPAPLQPAQQTQRAQAPAVRLASATEPIAEGRPFDNATTRPTVTAYLNLFREEFDESAPNYHTFVRPRLEQEQATRRQQVQQQRLRRKRERYQSAGPRVTTAENAGNAARFGDTGGYFSTWTR